jgi:hypothetical protein
MSGVCAPSVVLSSVRMYLAVARAGALLVIVAAVIFAAGGARADDNVDRLSKLLQESEDFRVRTQAALALGASKSKEAVQPLCAGLNDSTTSVRAASAAALGKLGKGGVDCLKERLAKEKEGGSVWTVIKKAIDRLEGGGGGGGSQGPAISASTKYYIAIEVTDKSGRAAGEVAGLVRQGMLKAAGRMTDVAVAPAGETAKQAEKAMAGHPGLRGFLLSTKAKEPKYTGGNLKVVVEVAIFTYPGRALKGTYPVGLTQQGVSSQDKASENQLFGMAAERAMEKFIEAAGRID